MMSQIMGIDSLLHDLARFFIFQKKIPPHFICFSSPSSICPVSEEKLIPI